MNRHTLVLGIVLLFGVTAVFAQDAEPTDEVDHAAHHPEGEATAELTPAAPVTSDDATRPADQTSDTPMDGMMGGMSGMMGMMMQMDMSPEMMVHMQDMQDMMHQMMNMSPSEMGPMLDTMQLMMETMMSMEMPDEMHSMMHNMMMHMHLMRHGMMGDMPAGHGAAGEGAMAGMEADSGYAVDEFAPLALAYYDDKEVYFIHTEASDAGVAQVLTDMMGADVIVVPALAEIPPSSLGNVYVFTNGVEAMGPLGFQPDVFDSVPGDEAYTPLRAISLVTWTDDAMPRELRSVEEIEAAQAAGEVTIEQPGVVVNMPILVWATQSR
jgi:hypothetical protein